MGHTHCGPVGAASLPLSRSHSATAGDPRATAVHSVLQFLQQEVEEMTSPFCSPLTSIRASHLQNLTGMQRSGLQLLKSRGQWRESEPSHIWSNNKPNLRRIGIRGCFHIQPTLSVHGVSDALVYIKICRCSSPLYKMPQYNWFSIFVGFRFYILWIQQIWEGNFDW